AYPFSEAPAFDFDIQLVDLDLPTLNPLFRSHLGIEVATGTLHTFAEVAADANGLKGYLKPLVEHLSVTELKKRGVWVRIKAQAIRAVAKLLKNKDVDRLATQIEFESDWLTERVNVPGAIGNFFKNAFQKAFRPILERSIGFAW